MMLDYKVVELLMKESGELMGKNTNNAQLYEFHKGQFLMARQILFPEKYYSEKGGSGVEP